MSFSQATDLSPTKKRKLSTNTMITVEKSTQELVGIGNSNAEPVTESDLLRTNPTTLFNHNVEILKKNGQWEKGTMSVEEESKTMVRLLVVNKNKTHVDQLLSIRTQFIPMLKTAIKWTADDFSLGFMKTIETTVRFKTVRIRDKFFNLWNRISKNLTNGNTQSLYH